MKCEILEALTNYTRKTMTEAEYRRYTARKELLAEEDFEEKTTSLSIFICPAPTWGNSCTVTIFSN